MTRPMVVIELADRASFARDLAAGGVFVPECTLRLAEDCDLVVCGVTHQMMIPARVVYVDPRGGAGLELIGFSPEMKSQLADLATAMPIDEPAADGPELVTSAPPPRAPTAPPTRAPTAPPMRAPTAPPTRAPTAPPTRAPTAPPTPSPAEPAAGTAAQPADYDELHSGFTEPVPLMDGDAIDEDDDLEIPSLFGRAPTGAPDEREAGALVAELAYAAHPEEDLAIPLSADEVYVATVEASAPVGSGASVFSYGRSGLTVRGGVAHRASSESGAQDADDSRMLGAELEAELGLGDFADADSHGEAALELELIDPWASAGSNGEAQLEDGEDVPGAGPDDGDGDGADAELDAGGDDGPALADGSRPDRKFPRNVHERLRGIPLAAQIKMASQGELHERIVLERLYGKNVWETLLRNPRLTAPEVARIARMGQLPRVLLEILVGNNAWLQIPEVRRALLSNPRLGTDQIIKVLRLTPKHELKLAAIQTAYPYTVRNAAKMMLRGE